MIVDTSVTTTNSLGEADLEILGQDFTQTDVRPALETD